MSLLILLYQEFKCMANRTNITDMVYCESIVNGLPIEDKYKQGFSNIVYKDSPGKRFGFTQRILDTRCIDMDMVEVDRGGNSDNTMDLVVGIAQYDNSRQSFSNNRFLPVELKLNCKSFAGITKKELLRKDRHTRDVLNGFSAVVDLHSAFIFTEEVAPSARNSKSRWKQETNSSNIKYWDMLSPQEYNTYIHFAEDYPYIPQTDINSIKNKIATLFSSNDIDGLIKFIDNNKKIAEGFKRKYNINECRAIANALSDSINLMISKNQDPDIVEYMLMLGEEVESLKKE